MIPAPVLPLPGYERVSIRAAELSNDGVHRYLLTRRWSHAGPALPVVLLNPSTADVMRDDATVRILMRYAWRWQLAGVELSNLYSFRCTDPRKLTPAERTGPLAGQHLDWLFASAKKGRGWVLVGWGDQGAKLRDFAERVELVRLLAVKHDVELKALGVTKAGNPWHPLRKPLSLQPQPWAPRS